MIKAFLASFSVFFSISLLTASAQGNFCDDKLIIPNWPDDKIEMGLECEISSTNFGDPERSEDFPRLCFGIMKMQSSDYKSTYYKTFRFHPAKPGGVISSVVRRDDGQVREGSISRQGSKMTIRNEKTSFGANQDWIESTTLDLADPSMVTFEIHDDGMFQDKLIYSSTYSCKRIQ